MASPICPTRYDWITILLETKAKVRKSKRFSHSSGVGGISGDQRLDPDRHNVDICPCFRKLMQTNPTLPVLYLTHAAFGPAVSSPRCVGVCPRDRFRSRPAWLAWAAAVGATVVSQNTQLLRGRTLPRLGRVQNSRESLSHKRAQHKGARRPSSWSILLAPISSRFLHALRIRSGHRDAQGPNVQFIYVWSENQRYEAPHYSDMFFLIVPSVPRHLKYPSSVGIRYYLLYTCTMREEVHRGCSWNISLKSMAPAKSCALVSTALPLHVSIPLSR